MMKKTTQLRQLYLGPKLFVLPGVSNSFEAKLVQAAGYQACYMSGGRTSAGLCGLPDAGLTTMTEVVLNARYIASAINLPLLSDADTGYGNALNVRRTVREFIAAGVGGIHIEDQVSPKRCGFLAGKEVIPIEEAVIKYRAAVDARNEMDPDFVIIARTDARGAAGGSLEDALRRAGAYRQAGADVAYVEALQSMEEVRRCIQELGRPFMATLSAIPTEELPSHQEMERLGFACAFYPGLGGLMASYRLQWEFLQDVRDRGVAAIQHWKRWEESFPWKYGPPPNLHELAGFAEIRKLEERYLSTDALAKYATSVGQTFPTKG